MAADNAKKPEAATILSVEAILAKADTPEDRVEVPEWGGFVVVRGLTKRQQIDIRRASMRDGVVDPEESQRRIWQEGVVDPRFPDEALGPLFDKNAGAVDRVMSRILELSGMNESAVRDREKTFRS
jgi:hypothetical protein